MASSRKRRAGPSGRGTTSRPAARTDAEHIAELYADIYDVARQIPRGCVATYGQVAELAGRPGAARVVGAAMKQCQPQFGVPWQRVVGKRSRGMAQINIHDPIGAAMQRALLEDEGVELTESGGIKLSEYGWIP